MKKLQQKALDQKGSDIFKALPKLDPDADLE